MSFPHETPAYQKLQHEAKEIGVLIQAPAAEAYPVTVELPNGDTQNYIFKRLKFSEWNRLIGMYNQIGVADWSKATEQDLNKLRYVQCEALGYASLEGKNADYWVKLDDKAVIDTCYLYVMRISAGSKEAVESLGWFRGDARGENIAGGDAQVQEASERTG